MIGPYVNQFEQARRYISEDYSLDKGFSPLRPTDIMPDGASALSWSKLMAKILSSKQARRVELKGRLFGQALKIPCKNCVELMFASKIGKNQEY